MDFNKYEDSIFKSAMDCFQAVAPDFFGLDVKIIAPAQTELHNIDIQRGYMDYIFYTADGGYLHFEFQTTHKA